MTVLVESDLVVELVFKPLNLFQERLALLAVVRLRLFSVENFLVAWLRWCRCVCICDRFVCVWDWYECKKLGHLLNNACPLR